MRRAKPFWLVLAAGLAVAGVLWWRAARGPSGAELAGWLPDQAGYLLYADFGVLRASGVLAMIDAPDSAREQDYRDFVAATGFDYARDLHRVAALLTPAGDLWISASGRFHPEKLSAYALSRGGRCVRGLCTMQGSGPSRQISWLDAGGEVLRLAVSADPLAAAVMNPGQPARRAPPKSPLWLRIPGALLKAGDGLPPGMSTLLSCLEGAEEAVFWVGLGGQGLTIEVQAPFSAGARAAAGAKRLGEATETLDKLLKRSPPGQADTLAALLASGRFRAEGAVLRGHWSVSRQQMGALLR